MAVKHFHLSTGSLFFTWLIAGILVLLLPQHITSAVWDVFRSTFNPLLKIGQHIGDGAPLNPDQAVTQEKYQQLWKDYHNLKATVRKLHEDYIQLSGVRAQLPQAYGGVVLADVIGTLSSYRHDVVLNKGSNDGVKQGQYVLSSAKNCIVGVILESSERYAKMRVLTDSKQTIEIRIVNEARGRDIPGLMVGNGKTACKIKMITREKRVETGDVVFAAARPGYLTIPVVVGEVSEINPDDEEPLLWDITVQPAADMTRLSDVAIIVIQDF